jgi:alpha-tubulin suppressor-like RCC1 family protein
VAWGDNSAGQLNIPTGLANVVAVSAGGYHNLALKGDGTVVAWGNSSSGGTTVPSGLEHVIAIAAGDTFDIALKSDGTLVAWGDNSAGQLNIPTGLANVIAITAGGSYGLALTNNSTLVSGFGINPTGQLSIPAGLYTVKSIASGSFNSLALKSDGTLVAWGATNGTDSGQNNIPPGLDNAVAAAAGYHHSLALTSDGTIVGWGSNVFGQTSIPAGLNNVKLLASGLYQGEALKSDGTVVAWGLNSVGQTNVPAGLANIRAIASGSQHMLALKADGTVVGWGDNRLTAITPPADLSHVIAIAAGGVHSLALKSDGTVVAWGINRNGQLDVPAGLNNVVAIGAAAETSVALKADGTVVAWGGGLPGISTVPAGLGNVTAIATGPNSTLVLYGAGEIDGTPPTTSVTTDPTTANGTNGWFTSNVTINFSADDAAGSGVQSITYSATGAQPLAATTVNGASASLVITTGGITTISYNARDAAGNVEAVRTLSIKLDKTAPSITTSARKANGTTYTAGTWTNQAVTVSFSCADTTSGIAGACPAAVTISAEGTTPSVSGSVSDQAGNSTSVSFGPILIDKTAPIVTATPDRAPDSNGWYNAPIAISFSGFDSANGSGNVTCDPAQTYSGPDSASASVSGTCTDAAGNRGSATTSFKYDATPSTVTAAASTQPNANGWYNGDVSVVFSCADALSGVASCPTDQTLSTEGAAVSSSAQSASDLAGNTSAPSNVVTVKLDRTAPVVSVTGVTNGASYPLGSAPAAACSTTDALSGVATAATLSITGGNAAGTGSFTATCAGATDKAGNTASASVNYTVAYRWSGFFQPVDNLPTINTVKAGSAIPVKFSLDGNYGLNIIAADYPMVQAVSCSTGAPTSEIEQTVTAGASSLNYDAATGQYNYVWKTDKAWAGSCRLFTIRLTDGTDHSALFQLR